MMDIVIPVRDGQTDSVQLKYSLRSIKRYLNGYGNIYIISTNFKTTELPYTSIDIKDVPALKQQSLYKKILTVCNDSRISDDFIYWHSDHFLLQSLHVNDIKPWYEATMADALGEAEGSYHTSILNAMQITGSDAKYFDVHFPCVFNKEKFKLISQYDWVNKEYGYVLKSMYFNLPTYQEDKLPVSVHDLKIKRLLSKDAIYHLIQDRLFFSTGPNGLKRQMLEVLEELYPDKSKWEL